MKKVCLFVMIFLLFFSVFYPVATSDLKNEQDKLAKYKMELERIKKEINNVNSDTSQVLSLLNNLENEMQNISENINVIQNKVNNLQNDIQSKEAEIKKDEQLIFENKNSIYTALNLSYKLSTISPAEIFFSGNNADLSLQRITYISYIASSNKKLLDDLNEKTKILVSQKEGLQRNEANLTAFLKQKESEQSMLKEEVSLKNQLLVSLKEKKLSDITQKNMLEEEIKQEQNKIEQLIKEANKGQLVLKGGFIWPARGPITSPFGWRINPIWHSREFHPGIDIAIGTGTPVHAAAAGIVSYAGRMTGYGNVVILYHGSNVSTLYAHLRNFVVKKEQVVKQGQIIAYSDNTGWSTGPHLHFGVYIGDKPVNPLKYLP